MIILKKIKLVALTSVLCLSTVFFTPVIAAEDPAVESEIRYNMEIQSNTWENWPTGPQVYAEAAIVMEAGTGTILYSKNIDQQMYPASITKLMTVLLALEHLNMDEEVTFSHNAVFSIDYNSSHIARDEGEILTVEECLYAILLESANECSNAIAEHISGSTEAFAELMNQRAAELGCTNTHFVNPHGLPDENHYTSSRDMALIAQEVIKHEKFRQISGTPRYTLRATNKKSEELLMNNHHYMISSYKTSRYLDNTVFGGKNGYTTVALNTLVTCATRNGMDLIVVTMKTQGSAERGVPVYTDTANLLNYASENFHKVNISENEENFTIGQGELFDTGTSIFGTTAPTIDMDPEGYVVLPVNADFADASPQLDFLDDSDSSIIATLSYTYAGQRIGSTSLLLSKSDIQEFEFGNSEEQDPSLSTASEENSGDEASSSSGTEVHLIRINLRTVGIVIGSILLLSAVLFFLWKTARDHDIELNPVKRWKNRMEKKNAFGIQNRRHYKSWKRRNNRKWF